MDCRVVVEAAVPVYDVATADEAVRIAISKTGEMLNPDLNYVEISMGERACPHCAEELEPAFIAADEGLVALELEMTVFNVDREEHASRVARKEIGQQLRNIPLEVLDVAVLEADDEDDDTTEDADAEAGGGIEEAADEADAATEETDAEDLIDGDAEAAESRVDGSGDDDAVLPEFEELMDE